MLGEQLVFAVTLTFPLAFSAGEEYWSMDFVPLKEAMFPSSLEEGGAASRKQTPEVQLMLTGAGRTKANATTVSRSRNNSKDTDANDGLMVGALPKTRALGAAISGCTSDNSSRSGSGGSGAGSHVVRETGRISSAVSKSSPTLEEWLRQGPYVLSMAPGFFGFYAHTGALIALEDEGLLERVSYATGASAGALVAGLFASGLSPRDMGETVVKFKRSDFWDPLGVGGFLRGTKFQGIIEDTLPEGVTRFDQCKVPLAVSAFDVSHLGERTITEGNLAPALRASCTFPLLFSPVWHSQGVLIDGGVRDTTGMWCVPTDREDCRRVLNVTFGAKDKKGVCVSPSRVPMPSAVAGRGLEIVSLALDGLPRPHPFAMERGAAALEAAKRKVSSVLGMPLEHGHEKFHWIAPTTAVQIHDFSDAVLKAGADLSEARQARKLRKRQPTGCDVQRDRGTRNRGEATSAQNQRKRDAESSEQPSESEAENENDAAMPQTKRSRCPPGTAKTAGWPLHSSQQCRSRAGTRGHGNSEENLTRQGTQGRLVSSGSGERRSDEGTAHRRDTTGRAGDGTSDDSCFIENSGSLIDIFASEGPRRRSKRYADTR